MSIDATRSVEIGDRIEAEQSTPAERPTPAEQATEVVFPLVVSRSRNHLHHDGLSDDERIRTAYEFGNAPVGVP